MSNNILILKCSVLDFHTSKEYKKKSTMRFFPLYIYLLRSKLLEQNIVFEMSSKYEVIY